MSSTTGTATASQRVAEAIADRILSGTLAPGTRIKQEELAAELDASRVPVREALRILEARGLVVLRANSGAWVSEMTRHDLSLSYQIRERIEPLLLVDSLPRLTDADLTELRDLATAIEATDDVEEFLVLDRRFHWASYRGHDAPQLAAMVERLWDTTQHYRREFARLAGTSRSWVINAEHRLLLEAVGRRDSETAEAVLAQHIGRTRLELSKHPELFADPEQPEQPG
jgi:DNA-binding GntR family transcriptional regulator